MRRFGGVKQLLFVFWAVGSIFVLVGCGADRIAVTNTGTAVIEVATDGRAGAVLLGQNGTGYFDRDATICLGDAAIRIGRRTMVTNTGSDHIKITYHDADGIEQTLILGQGGTGHLDPSVPFRINQAVVQAVTVRRPAILYGRFDEQVAEHIKLFTPAGDRSQGFCAP